MTKVKVLVQGYASKKEGRASSTSALIIEDDIKVIVDPGIDREKLLNSLKKENLSAQDINYVVLTHTHVDHAALTGIFENAKIVDNSEISTFEGGFRENPEAKIPSTNIQIIQTPGHDQFHCSLLVKTDDMGKVVVAGDLFWWWDKEEQKTDQESLLNRQDPYVKDKKAIDESRKKILDIADYIIPGHGKMFKVERE